MWSEALIICTALISLYSEKSVYMWVRLVQAVALRVCLEESGNEVSIVEKYKVRNIFYQHRATSKCEIDHGYQQSHSSLCTNQN